jgi:hypothetical protein
MRSILVSTLAVAATWLLGLLVALTLGSGSRYLEPALTVLYCSAFCACVVARVEYAAYALAGLSVFFLVEASAHFVWGSSHVQGGPTHLAIMAAAFGGVGFGAVLWARRPLTRRDPDSA